MIHNMIPLKDSWQKKKKEKKKSFFSRCRILPEHVTNTFTKNSNHHFTFSIYRLHLVEKELGYIGDLLAAASESTQKFIKEL